MGRVQTGEVLQPGDGQHGSEARSNRRLHEGERTAVAKAAAMLGRMLMEMLRCERNGLGANQRAQQEQKGEDPAHVRSL